MGTVKKKRKRFAPTHANNCSARRMVSEHLKLGNFTFPQAEDPLQHPYHSPRPTYELVNTCHPRLQDIRHLWKHLAEAYSIRKRVLPCSLRSNRASKIGPTGVESCVV